MSEIRQIALSKLDLICGGDRLACLRQNSGDIHRLNKDWSDYQVNADPVWLASLWEEGRSLIGLPSEGRVNYRQVESKINDELRDCLTRNPK